MGIEKGFITIYSRLSDDELEQVVVTKPAILQEDIVLSGELKALEQTEDPKLPLISGPVVEISIFNYSGKPLVSIPMGYCHIIYLYIDGFSGILEDFYQGITSLA